MDYTAGIFGKRKGICTKNQDPEGLLRIKVRVPGLFDEELEEWALPSLPPGVNTTPEIGQGVWVEFEAGDENAPIWTGCWYDKSRKPGLEFKALLTEAVVQVFNGHTHAVPGYPTTQAPTQQLDATTHATKMKGR